MAVRFPQPLRNTVRCDVCRLAVHPGAAVLFALQEAGCGPYPGQPGWYVATVHVTPCGDAFIGENRHYSDRACRGCGRPMWLRPTNRRTHCSGACRQADYRRRAKLMRETPWLDRQAVYWATRPQPPPSNR